MSPRLLYLLTLRNAPNNQRDFVDAHIVAQALPIHWPRTIPHGTAENGKVF